MQYLRGCGHETDGFILVAVYDLETQTLYVDNTTLSAFATCPTKAMVRYGWNLKPQGYLNTPMQCGISIHKAIEAHYCGASIEEAVAEWRQDYFEYAVNNVPSDDRYGLQNIELAIRSWIQRHSLESLPYRIPDPSHIEKPFNLPLSSKHPKIRYVGRIDAIVEEKQKPTKSARKPVRFVLDNKSAGRVDAKYERQYILGSQMSGYFFASQKLWPEFDIGGIYINVVSTQQVPNSHKKCYVHRVPYHECGWLHPKHQLLGPYFRSPGEIEEWRIDALSLALQWKTLFEEQLKKHDIRRVPQYGKWIYEACSGCELLPYCRAGRPENYAWEGEEWVPGDLTQR